ncbi:hypothetical protein K443DRAFT_655162 [Laccaria amethystina LaAM-08-1]|uniref:Uncharacterized protein n=1 Tax=Laccaria amethystina LaAM-08-1 TaxID=1095629 RepID=A0A0C9XZE8_9AGAR|nr:hypothetical protein K443DRAFT_655162 [Laccaria amethystina LaAM-08-1]
MVGARSFIHDQKFFTQCGRLRYRIRNLLYALYECPSSSVREQQVIKSRSLNFWESCHNFTNQLSTGKVCFMDRDTDCPYLVKSQRKNHQKQVKSPSRHASVRKPSSKSLHLEDAIALRAHVIQYLVDEGGVLKMEYSQVLSKLVGLFAYPHTSVANLNSFKAVLSIVSSPLSLTPIWPSSNVQGVPCRHIFELENQEPEPELNSSGHTCLTITQINDGKHTPICTKFLSSSSCYSNRRPLSLPLRLPSDDVSSMSGKQKGAVYVDIYLHNVSFDDRERSDRYWIPDESDHHLICARQGSHPLRPPWDETERDRRYEDYSACIYHGGSSTTKPITVPRHHAPPPPGDEASRWKDWTEITRGGERGDAETAGSRKGRVLEERERRKHLELEAEKLKHETADEGDETNEEEEERKRQEEEETRKKAEEQKRVEDEKQKLKDERKQMGEEKRKVEEEKRKVEEEKKRMEDEKKKAELEVKQVKEKKKEERKQTEEKRKAEAALKQLAVESRKRQEKAELLEEKIPDKMAEAERLEKEALEKEATAKRLQAKVNPMNALAKKREWEMRQQELALWQHEDELA